MKRLCFYFPTILIIISGENPCLAEEDESRIVGGFEANKADYPYAVSLRDPNNHHFCGGTLIDHEHVVTAAHCVAGLDLLKILSKILKSFFPVFSGRSNVVVVGSDSLDKGGSTHKVISTTVHPEYDPKLVVNDIALLKIEPVTSYKFSFPVRMQSNLSDYENPCYVMGWGLTEAGGKLSNKFKVAEVHPVSPTHCEEEWKEAYNPNVICTTSDGNSACQGDSGGPLICDEKFTGIVSFGKPCATGKPDVFTSVFAYNEWIDKNME
ncbi:chymotrypsin-like proteinase 5C isoform 1 precursor [Tribolium castaneum]|eukprot:NP_001161088.1 chymotrypsin-like proteinase 5C isoform 1 precursor [Tribolium castaneum]